MTLSPLYKQMVGCNSPHDWLMRLVVYFAALYDMCSGNGTINGCHLVVVTLLPSIPIGLLVVLVIASEKLLKMVDNSVSYSVTGWSNRLSN